MKTKSFSVSVGGATTSKEAAKMIETTLAAILAGAKKVYAIDQAPVNAISTVAIIVTVIYED